MGELDGGKVNTGADARQEALIARHDDSTMLRAAVSRKARILISENVANAFHVWVCAEIYASGLKASVLKNLSAASFVIGGMVVRRGAEGKAAMIRQLINQA